MRWTVEGADAKTGDERVIEVEARDEPNAEALARGQGLLVSRVTPAGGAPAPAPPHGGSHGARTHRHAPAAPLDLEPRRADPKRGVFVLDERFVVEDVPLAPAPETTAPPTVLPPAPTATPPAATDLTPPPPPPPELRRSAVAYATPGGTDARVPEYVGLRVGAGVLMVFAMLYYLGALILFTFAAFTLFNGASWAGTASALVLFAWGMGTGMVGGICHALSEAAIALRDIARNSFNR